VVDIDVSPYVEECIKKVNEGITGEREQKEATAAEDSQQTDSQLGGYSTAECTDDEQCDVNQQLTSAEVAAITHADAAVSDSFANAFQVPTAPVLRSSQSTNTSVTDSQSSASPIPRTSAPDGKSPGWC